MTSISDLKNKYKKKLHSYKFLKNPKDLHNGYLIKYIKKENDRLAFGGKVIEIVNTPNNKDIYKIKIKSNLGNEWYVLKEKVYIFYKDKTVYQERRIKNKEWLSKLKPIEYKMWKKLSPTDFAIWYKRSKRTSRKHTIKKNLRNSKKKSKT